MHSRVAESEGSNQQQPRVLRRRKYKRRKKELQRLTAENRYLKEVIEGLISDYLQVDVQKQENSVSRSACQTHHPSFYVQDQQEIEATAEWDDVMELNDLNDPLSTELAVNVTVTENSKNSQTIQKNATMADFLKTIDEDVASNVDFSDFMICLEGEQKTIGRYSFPMSLVPTVERIIKIYGDVSAASLMNSNVTANIYLFFCATIKEMEDLELHQVTEKKLLKWRDAIKDALRIRFKVDFAMQHLKRIARAHFGRVGSQDLQSIDDKLNALYKERAETYEGLKDCLADAKDFYGKSVSYGLFP